MTAVLASMSKAAVEPGPKVGGKFHFLTVSELKARPVMPWRVLKVIPGRGLIVLWGAPGSGKSFVLLDIGMAITRGVPWHGRRVRAGAFVLVTTEGTAAARVAAYQDRHDIADDDLGQFRILESSINLLDPRADLPHLLADIKTLQDEIGTIAVVAIDTLNRAMPGGNENDAEDMGLVVAAAKQIEALFQCAVVFVHHSGKDETRGARGHNSLKAAADTELSVKHDAKAGLDSVRSMTAEKMRDAEDGKTLLTFKLASVDLGPMADIDPEAEPDERHTSCVVLPIDAGALPSVPVKRPQPSGKNQKLVLQALQRAVSQYGVHIPGKPFADIKGVTIAQLRDEAAREELRHVDPKHRSSRFTDALSSLKADRFVDWSGDLLWPASRNGAPRIGTGTGTELPGITYRGNSGGDSVRTERHRNGDFGDSVPWDGDER